MESKKRICIIGSSHLACFKLAWDDGLKEKYQKVELTFFSSVGSSMNSLEAHKNYLSSSDDKVVSNMQLSSGGLDRIIPADYDCVIIHGLSPAPINYLEGTTPFSRGAFYSHGAIIRCTSAFAILQKLKSISDIPVFISHAPGLAELSPDERITSDEYNELIEGLKHAHRDVGSIYVSQPASTICKHLYTKRQYVKGAKRLVRVGNTDPYNEFPEDDIGHMNEEFGKVYLGEILDLLPDYSSTKKVCESVCA